MVKDCGADCAKFQKSELDHKFNKAALVRPYHSKHSWGETYGDHKRHLEFSHEQFHELKKFAEEEVGICFTASAMDLKAIDFLLDDLRVRTIYNKMKGRKPKFGERFSNLILLRFICTIIFQFVIKMISGDNDVSRLKIKFETIESD